jgi:hypothetical protein
VAGIEISGIEHPPNLSVTLSRAYKWNSEDAGNATADLNGRRQNIFSLIRQNLFAVEKRLPARNITSQKFPRETQNVSEIPARKFIVLSTNSKIRQRSLFSSHNTVHRSSISSSRSTSSSTLTSSSTSTSSSRSRCHPRCGRIVIFLVLVALSSTAVI